MEEIITKSIEYIEYSYINSLSSLPLPLKDHLTFVVIESTVAVDIFTTELSHIPSLGEEQFAPTVASVVVGLPLINISVGVDDFRFTHETPLNPLALKLFPGGKYQQSVSSKIMNLYNGDFSQVVLSPTLALLPYFK